MLARSLFLPMANIRQISSRWIKTSDTSYRQRPEDLELASHGKY